MANDEHFMWETPEMLSAIEAADAGDFTMLEALVRRRLSPAEIGITDVTLTRSDGVAYHRSPGGAWSRLEQTRKT